MSSWVRCERCRRVLPGGDFDEGQATCRLCNSTPVKTVRSPRASAVTRSRVPSAPAAPPAPRAPLMGVTGSGDLEVRERRARRAALDQLAEAHEDEFATLLAQARAAEGLRA